MRFVPVTSLLEGMVCAKNLYDINNQLLLSKGCVVLDSYVERIKELGYQGIYIEDDLSEDVHVKDVISDNLRISAIKAVKDIYIYSENPKLNKDKLDQKVTDTKVLISHIVDEILANKDTMVNLIDLKFYDDYTFFHSVNVAVLSIIIGEAYGLGRSDLLNLGLSAILHDIGKMFIDKDLLNKPGKLTNEEYELIKQHPRFGYNFLKESYEIATNVYVAVLQHHERYDGLGYPFGKKATEILLNARIICMTDVYDALTSARPYREPLLPSEAMEYVMANGGSMFDLNLTRIFAKKVAPFPVGTYVRLSSGQTGIVMENYEDACMRPLIKLIIDASGKPMDPIKLDLRNDQRLRSVTITAINEMNMHMSHT